MIGLESINLLWLALIAVFLYSIYVKGFKRVSQTEREAGLDSHKIKNGTITMGGIIFLVLPIFFIPYTNETRIIYFTTISFGLLGLIDDLLIIKFKKNDGLAPTIKLICEVIISGIVFYFYLKNDYKPILNIFGISINIKWLFGLFILFILVSSSNAWNLVDGVDGLCSGCSIIFGIGLMIIAIKKGSFDIFHLLLIFHICLFVFWCFNLPKAFLFMGDVGSLGLGAFYAIAAVFLNSINAYILMSLLFIFETITVILQVSYFKKTNGKRLFRMTPFHHHLEMKGFSELKIDLLFYIIQIILVLIAINI